MARKFLRRYLPDIHWVKKQKSLNFLGDWLHEPNLWHLNHSSVSKAVFCGLFCAFIPVPWQMVLSSFLAVYVRANLPISIAMVWITNPVTMPAIYYFTYKLGTVILNQPPQEFAFELSWQWLANGIASTVPALFVGSMVCGLFLSTLGAALVRLLWRRNVQRKWKARQRERAARSAGKNSSQS